METVKAHYQHLYVKGGDEVNASPRVTICYLRSDQKTYVGVSVCSREDNPCKRTGRKISRNRAYAAMNGCWLPLLREEPRLIIGEAAGYFLSAGRSWCAITSKSFWVNDPTFMVTGPKVP